MVMVSAVGGVRSDRQLRGAVASGNLGARSSPLSLVPSVFGRNTLMAYCAATLLSSLTQSRFKHRTLSRSEGFSDGLEGDRTGSIKCYLEESTDSLDRQENNHVILTIPFSKLNFLTNE